MKSAIIKVVTEIWVIVIYLNKNAAKVASIICSAMESVTHNAIIIPVTTTSKTACVVKAVCCPGLVMDGAIMSAITKLANGII